jgi:predicted TPR repeat methyltransferase
VYDGAIHLDCIKTRLMQKTNSQESNQALSTAEMVEHAQSLLADGMVDAADRLFRTVLEKDKTSAAALRGRAAVAETRGHNKRAARFSQKANEQEAEDHCSAAEKASDDALYSKTIECYEKALAVVTDNLDAIWGIAESYAALDERDEAASWYQRYLDIEPDEPEALHMLSAMGVAAAPERASDGYVATLFDRFAPDFDDQLTGELEYQVPTILAETAKDYCSSANGDLDILDLGCGTGLCGEAVKDLAKRLDGVDLSGEMLKLARKRRVYKTLTKSEVVAYMDKTRRSYDLVLGADVFVYFGLLDELFVSVASILKPGGLVIFSLEAQEGAGFHLTASGRYAHGRAYVRGCVQAAGLRERSVNNEKLRIEYGEPVGGDIWVLQNPD